MFVGTSVFALVSAGCTLVDPQAVHLHVVIFDYFHCVLFFVLWLNSSNWRSPPMKNVNVSVQGVHVTSVRKVNHSAREFWQIYLSGDSEYKLILCSCLGR